MPRYGEGSVVGQSYTAQPSRTSDYLLGAGTTAGGGMLVSRAIRPSAPKQARKLALGEIAAGRKVDAAQQSLVSASPLKRSRAASVVAAAQRDKDRIVARRTSLTARTPRLLSGAHRAKVGTLGVGMTLAGLGVLANTRRPQ